MATINPNPISSTPITDQAAPASSKTFQKHMSASDRLDDGIRAIHRDEKRLNSAIHRAERGADFDNQELIRMQALAYRYSQRVELASKVVEQATSGVKQILNTQV